MKTTNFLLLQIHTQHKYICNGIIYIRKILFYDFIHFIQRWLNNNIFQCVQCSLCIHTKYYIKLFYGKFKMFWSTYFILEHTRWNRRSKHESNTEWAFQSFFNLKIVLLRQRLTKNTEKLNTIYVLSFLLPFRSNYHISNIHSNKNERSF